MLTRRSVGATSDVLQCLPCRRDVHIAGGPETATTSAVPPDVGHRSRMGFQARAALCYLRIQLICLAAMINSG